jgi:hypothetical protein
VGDEVLPVMGTEPVCSLLIANHGRYAVTGSPSLSLPASRSCMTAVAVNSFEIEATRYSVSGVGGVFVSVSANPNPRDHTSSWSWTMPIAGRAEHPGCHRTPSATRATQ